MRLFVAAFAILGISSAQNVISATQDRQPDGSTKTTIVFGGPPFGLAQPLRNRPYSGEQITSRTRILADGTRLEEKGARVLMFRDAAGRRRLESTFADDIRIVEIRDYVTGEEITLDPQNRIAHRTRFSQNNATREALPVDHFEPASTSAAKPQVVRRNLGSKTIDGLICDGTMETTTIPAGARGNDKPLVSTTETWTAREIAWRIYTRHNDPKDGETVTRMIDIHASEPSPRLFEIPAGYTIRDETERYSIEVLRPAMSSTEREVRNVVRQFADARNAHDGPAAAKVYAPTGEYVAGGGQSVKGAEELAKLWGAVTGQANRVIRSVEMFPPNVAVALVDAHFTTPDGEQYIDETFVLARDKDQGWKIQIHSASDVHQ